MLEIQTQALTSVQQALYPILYPLLVFLLHVTVNQMAHGIIEYVWFSQSQKALIRWWELIRIRMHGRPYWSLLPDPLYQDALVTSLRKQILCRALCMVAGPIQVITWASSWQRTQTKPILSLESP